MTAFKVFKFHYRAFARNFSHSRKSNFELWDRVQAVESISQSIDLSIDWVGCQESEVAMNISISTASQLLRVFYELKEIYKLYRHHLLLTVLAIPQFEVTLSAVTKISCECTIVKFKDFKCGHLSEISFFDKSLKASSRLLFLQNLWDLEIFILLYRSISIHGDVLVIGLSSAVLPVLKIRKKLKNILLNLQTLSITEPSFTFSISISRPSYS